MEAKDLRIGNLVFIGVNVCEIKGIHTQSYGESHNREHHFYIRNLSNDNMHYSCVHPHEIKPIPITHEWLIKLGYTSDEPILSDNPSIYRKGNHKIWCPFDRFLDEYYRFEIKYVHQLQNLYFTTQQEELKLEQS